MNVWVVLTAPEAPWSVVEPRIGEHRDHQQHLLDAGALLASGPFLADDGQPAGTGLTLLRADTREQAEALAAADPLVRDGLRSVTVHLWRVTQTSAELHGLAPGMS